MVAQLDGSDPLIFLGALAVLILLGFVGNLIFSKLRFNDTLILILVGVIVGPITGVIAPESLAAVTSIVGPLALILILFDGGLALKVHDLMHGLGSAAVLGIIGFITTTLLVGGLAAFALDIPVTTGLVLGSILGGTSALVVLPSLQYLNVKKKTGTTLGLESALTDVLVVVVSFTLIAIVASAVPPEASLDSDLDGLDDAWELSYFFDAQPNAYIYNGSSDPDQDGYTNLEEFEGGTDPTSGSSIPTGVAFDAQGIASKLLITFAMSIFMGVTAGFVWLFMYPRVRDKPFGYMLTLGFVFFLYVFVEWILSDVSSGGGPLAVLAFGIILGNYESFGARFIETVGQGFGQGMKRFQGELSFLVRTFFFIYLGVLVELDTLKEPGTWGIGLLLFAGLLGARYVAVMATTRKLHLDGDATVMWMMGPRGLAAAVLAAIPAELGIPGTERFVALAFLILVLSNLLPTIGTIVLEQKQGSKKSPTAEPEPATKVTRSSSTTVKRTSSTKFKESTSTQKSLEDLGRKGKSGSKKKK